MSCLKVSFNLDVNVYILNIHHFEQNGQISLYEYIVNFFVTIPHFYKISTIIKV